MRVARAAVPLRGRPDPGVGLVSEVLFGETVVVYDEANGWAWVQADRDRYVGYLPADALSPDLVEATHRVSSIGTFVYQSDDFKSPPLMHLSLNSRLAVEDAGERFSRLSTGGFVISRHIMPIGRQARDYVEIAERLIGTPYLWGGRTRIGLDCSGLVQLAMEAAGLDCPRDTDMQEAAIGATVLVPGNLEGLQRGDLVFWRGHVGVLADGIILVHANAYHMATVAEPLETAVARIARSGSELVGVKRPRVPAD